ncbi:MAG: class I SAM-dependent methyltransferase [Deltaproteobacteria bacterium]|nr:class I SAM-dependent methyltransferase [Deltaproteobacteria bacterium]
MLHSLRYLSILRILKKSGFSVGKHRIAEVGSGESGMSGYIGKSFIGCDINFQGKPPERMLPVRCSVFKLPFRDRSVDFVVSSDMMEHIPVEMREAAIIEMLRVTSRCLVLAFPEGEGARECDTKVLRTLEESKKKIPSWLSEHLEEKNKFPTAKEVSVILDRIGLRYRVYSNENLLLHTLGVRLESNSVFKKLDWWTRKIPSHHLWKIVLPFVSMGRTYRSFFAVYCNERA